MIDMLECAIAQALKQVRAVDGFIDLIVLCNTCHFFLPAAMKRLADSQPSIAPRLRLTSLIDSAIKAIHRARFMRIMALYTEGTKVSQIYLRPLNQGNRCSVEITDLQPLLSESIYYGVKAFDDEVTVSLGSVIFDDLLNESHQFDCILAGCTEVPLIVNRLKACSTKRITDFLAKVEIIDPVAEALAAV
jgi:aspartate/glutamate racemase